MRHPANYSLHRLVQRAVALPLLVLVLGCGDGSPPIRTLPVAGTITVDGEPLRAQEGTVLFKPNKVKGNTTSWEPFGSIDGNGRYSLQTAGKRGAPPGWYRVIVAAYETPPTGKPSAMFKPAHYDVRVNRRYGDAKTSGLEVEVVEKPESGPYDLKLTK
jgi:hypothetical protein